MMQRHRILSNLSTKWFFETATPSTVGCKSFSSLSYSVFPLQEALKRVIKRLLWESSNRCPSYLQSTPGIQSVPEKTVTRWSKISSNQSWIVSEKSLKHSKETFLYEKNKRNLDLKYLRIVKICNFNNEIYATNDWIFNLKDHGTFENIP